VVAVSVTLAVLTFALGYLVYEQTLGSTGFIRVVPESEDISKVSHSASGAVNNSLEVRFEMSGPSNATAWVEATPGGKFALKETSPGDYSGTHRLEGVTESTTVKVMFFINKSGEAVWREGEPITVDLTPPEIGSARTQAPAYTEGEELTLVVEAEPKARVTAELLTLSEPSAMKETSPGTYTLGYLVRRGDSRDSITVRVTAEDALGNAAQQEFTLPTTITTAGPRLLSLERTPAGTIGYGETVEFTVRGEPGATGYLDLDTAKNLPLIEGEAGVFKAEYTLNQPDVGGESPVIVRLTKDVTSSKKMGYVLFDSEAPVIKTFASDVEGAVGAGKKVTITMLAEENGTAYYRIAGLVEYRKMDAIGGGTYKAEFTPTNESVQNAEITGYFFDAAGNGARPISADERLTVETTMPEIAETAFEAPPLVNANTVMRAALRSEEGGKASVGFAGGEYPLSETTGGWYEANFSLGAGNDTKQAEPRFTFTDAAGNAAPAVTGAPVTIDNEAPKIIFVTYTAPDLLRVGAVMNVTMQGEAGGKAWFVLRDVVTNHTIGPVYLYEGKPGEYAGKYQVKDTDAVGRAVVIGYLADAAGNEARPFLVQPTASASPFQLNLLMGLAVLVFIIPTFLFYYNKHVETASYEEMFPDFLSELHSVMGSQLPLPQAMKIIANSNYGHLSGLIKRMNNRIIIGMPFPEAFAKLASETKSKSIASAVSVLVSSYKAGGGRLAKIFNATATNFRQLRSMKHERTSELQVHVVTGYIIFIVFIGVLVTLNNSLFNPALLSGNFISANSSAPQTLEQMVSKLQKVGETGVSTGKFTDLLFYLFFIQAFFSGVSIGELTEGSFMAGLKHAVIMMLIALIATAFLI
jgi:hypothetical protein